MINNNVTQFCAAACGDKKQQRNKHKREYANRIRTKTTPSLEMNCLTYLESLKGYKNKSAVSKTQRHVPEFMV